MNVEEDSGEGFGYRVKIEYEYEVDWVTYRSNRRCVGDFVFMPNRHTSQEIARQYRGLDRSQCTTTP